MANPEHALDKQRGRGRAGTDRVPGHDSSDYTAPGVSGLGGIISVYVPGEDPDSCNNLRVRTKELRIRRRGH